MSDRLEALRAKATLWLTDVAAPLWATAGIDPLTGSFHEALDQKANPTSAPLRARVPPRQVHALSVARQLGADIAPAVISRGWARYRHDFERRDGLFRTLVDCKGNSLDERAVLYDHAFVLLALSSCPDSETEARALCARIREAFSIEGGGFRDVIGSLPARLSNPHMHLLEACLAWAARDGGGGWHEMAAEIVALALRHFRLPRSGAIAERFESGWRPFADDSSIEPGHQFEWAWLLACWSRQAGDSAAATAAQELLAFGEHHGVDAARGVALNSLSHDLRITDGEARLWPQTERLKAWCAVPGPYPTALAAERACEAATAIDIYLKTKLPGLWHDRMMTDGTLYDGPAPASSLYHLACAIQVMNEALGKPGRASEEAAVAGSLSVPPADRPCA